jgi:hypothetical protein
VTWQLSWRITIGCLCVGTATLVGLSCELVVAPGALQNGDCGAGRKACENPGDGVSECVGIDDPNFQCASSSCSPCSLPHAIPICGAAGTCAIGSCTQAVNLQGQVVEAWNDCDQSPGDGCEVDLLHGILDSNGEVENCGGCGTTCAAANARANGCLSGSCVINECMPGFVHCDDNPSTGCRIEVGDGGCDGE